MAKIIDDETLDNVCVLAKLSLDENTREKTREDMQKMLDYVDKLNELDTDGVEPLTHLFAEENVFREDTVVNGDSIFVYTITKWSKTIRITSTN